jgi:hypothetical protein
MFEVIYQASKFLVEKFQKEIEIAINIENKENLTPQFKLKSNLVSESNTAKVNF